MNKLVIGLSALVLLLSACAPQSPTETPTIIIEPPGKSDPVEDAVVAQLAGNLNLDKNEITVISNEKVEFNDACLGVAIQDVMCTQVVTPGHIVILEAHDFQYEYHANEDGSMVQPATLALTWRREGGIAGFCDSLTVFLSGEVYGNQCKSEPAGTMGTFATLLSQGEYEQFSGWITQYGPSTLNESDPKGVPDGMTNIIELYGIEKGKPGKPVEAEIFAWAGSLFQELYS